MRKFDNLADAFEWAKKFGKAVGIMKWKQFSFKVTIEKIDTPVYDHPTPPQPTAAMVPVLH